MSQAGIDQFLNTKFPSIGSLTAVDTVIHEIENKVSDQNSLNRNASDSNNSIDNGSFIEATEFLNLLKSYVKTPTEEGLNEVNDLLIQYGNVPAITYTKDLLEQKLKLLKESQIRENFVIILNKLNDFEIFELNDLSGIESSYEERVKLVEKISILKDEITNFQKSAQTSNYHLDVNVNQLSHELENKLEDVIKTGVCPIFKKKLISKVDNWDQDTTDNKSSNSSKSIDSTTINEFNLFLNLQLIVVPHEKFIAGSASDFTFWAIDCLTNKFQTKFIFHFEGSGETNRLDKPEFAFSYLIGYLRKNISYAKLLFAADFAKCCRNNVKYGEISGSFSTWFITSTLIPLRRKFSKEISLILETKNGHLLSHFVTEVKKFDEEIKQEFAFIPIKGKEWGGFTNDLILSQNIVWNAWLQNEKNFVNERFEEIVEMDDAFSIEYDVVEKGKTKPTKSAINLTNLLEGITINYDSLPLKYQLKFLSEVQLKLLNFYFDTLKKGAYALKSIKQVQIDGVSTLERICRIWCSSKYIIEMMEKWSDQIIFIELWKSLNNGEGQDAFETTFFESVINGYEKEILAKIPKLVANYFESQLNRTMKGYFEVNNDWTFTIDKTAADSELDFVIQTLAKDLNYLQTTVSSVTFNSWKLLLSNTVASYFEKNIALVNNFTVKGANKLVNDVDNVFQSVNLVKSFDSYGRLMVILHVLKTGKLDVTNTESGTIDDSELAMLLMRRR